MIIVKRRNLLIGMAGLTLSASSGDSLKGAPAKKSTALPEQTGDNSQYDLKLRPHHILDIVTSHGQDVELEPAPSGHSLHIVSPQLLSNLDLKVKLIVGSDDVCTGCGFLKPDGKCSDVLAQLKPSPSKQSYNDVLDCRLLDALEIEINSIKTARDYLEIVNRNVPGIEEICTHPKENREERLSGLIKGLIKLGIREKA